MERTTLVVDMSAETESNLEQPRLLLLANRRISQVADALRDLRPWLEARATIVAEPEIHELDRDSAAALPEADLALVLGGDGTLLAQARHLADVDVPLVGVNFGKLGFLAEFSLEDLKESWGEIVSGSCRASERVMIDAQVFDTDPGVDTPPSHTGLALNDVVITAGPPFRMIELELTIDPERWGNAAATTFSCDGVIVATPSGSTAYNLAAGGPIVSPQCEVLCITPICPHSLAFRPIVVAGDVTVQLRAKRANDGTTLVLDGQESLQFGAGQTIRINRHRRRVRLLQNPTLSYWKVLAHKMHWAARPRRG